MKGNDMYRILKPKNIRRFINLLALIAPIVYLFATQIFALAGAHGEEVLADSSEVLLGYEERAYSQLFDGHDIEIDSDEFKVYSTVYLVKGTYVLMFYQDYQLVSDTRNTWLFQRDSVNTFENTASNNRLNVGWYTWRFSVSDSGYYGFLYWLSGPLPPYSISPTYYIRTPSLFNLTYMYGIGNEPATADFVDQYPYGSYEQFTGVREYPVYGAGTYADTLYNSFFTPNNFLEQFGHDALAHQYGFQPMNDLLSVVDSVADIGGTQLGRMAYGYLAYCGYVLLLNLVAGVLVFIFTWPDLILDKLHGGID